MEIAKRLKSIKSTKNAELIKSFCDNCYSEGLGDRRVIKYVGELIKLVKLFGKDLDKVTEEDVRRVVSIIERSDYKDWTKRDYKVAIRKFYKWLEGDNEEYPKKVRWIKSRIKDRHRLPEEILTQGDIRKLIEASDNLRDRALISTLYESGCRISELLGLKIKHISFDEYGAVLLVNGKTGSRRIRIISSVPYLSNWIENHSNKNDPEAYLWISLATNRKGLIDYQAIRVRLKKISKKAGVKKRVNPHSFRHARATHLANKLTEAQMKEFFGWVQGSDMASVYVHLSGRDMDNAILEIHGLKEVKKDVEEDLKIKVCSRCETKNSPTSKFCNRCSMALDLKTAMGIQEKQNEYNELTAEYFKDCPKELNKLIEKKIEQILDKKKTNLKLSL